MDNGTDKREKDILTSKEAAAFLGVSLSYLYKLTSTKEIPYFKPHGKMCYFDRADLLKWIKSGRISSDAELTREAQRFCMQKGGLK